MPSCVNNKFFIKNVLLLNGKNAKFIEELKGKASNYYCYHLEYGGNMPLSRSNIFFSRIS